MTQENTAGCGRSRRFLSGLRKGCCSDLALQPPAVRGLSRNARTCIEGPFGEPLRATGPMAKANPLRFSTKYQDAETDLLYYGYRYYNASIGRWLSRDPIAEWAFGLNGPVNGVDLPPLLAEASEYAFIKNGGPLSVDALGLAIRIGPFHCPTCYWHCWEYSRTPQPIWVSKGSVGTWVCAYLRECKSHGYCNGPHQWFSFGLLASTGPPAKCPPLGGGPSGFY
jgi:RHS repeat-associated protein